ncbi:ferrochelatase [Oleiphilus messinensis]|uniref:ferrochelatase n=1 Tax=Oleiphilus messinensis TaxID=141451 RepID=UPI001E535B63|nr:ferrochelatase [Oleiphilus messinensis]
MKNRKSAVVLLNLGTPDAPESGAIRRYLKAFLGDPRVVEAPRIVWWLVLNLVILVFRPRKLVEPYSKLWKDGDSPLRALTIQQTEALKARLQGYSSEYPEVCYAMTYGHPGVETVLSRLMENGTEHVLILPLYPQYSGSTSGAAFDVVAKKLMKTRHLPGITFIKDYHDHPAYIEALADSVRNHWQTQGQQNHLLMSYHGIPKAYVEKGDPYLEHCQTTSRLLAEALNLSDTQWSMSFQSRVGRAEWLQPYTDETMKKLGKENLSGLDVICPGFSADCLETLEEIDEENREYFTEAGGQNFHYIPALNANAKHIDMMEQLVQDYLG